jgi:hypothetical protein
LDRVFLIERLALVLNAAAMLFAFRSRWSPIRVGSRASQVVAAGWSGAIVPADAPDAGKRLQAVERLDAPDPGDTESPQDDDAEPPEFGIWLDEAAREWADRVEAETVRFEREGRPGVVVALRLDGLEAVAADGGPEVAAWLCRVAAGKLRESARGSDLVQVDPHGSFRVLLAETNDAGADAYVQRASRLMVPWLDGGPTEVHIIAGWAGTSSLPDLEAAYRLAQARLTGVSEGWIRSASARRWPDDADQSVPSRTNPSRTA